MKNRSVPILVCWFFILSFLLPSCSRTLPDRPPAIVLVAPQADIESICINADVDFPESIIEKVTVDAFVEDVLSSLGLIINDGSSGCDAELSLFYRAKGELGHYLGGNCYTGGSVFGEIRLTQGSAELYVSDFSVYKQPPVSVLSSQCEVYRTEGAYPFEYLWLEPTTEMLMEIWGPRVLVWISTYAAIDVEDQIDQVGPTNEMITEWIYALHADGGFVPYNAAKYLGRYGKAAEQALPYLNRCSRDKDQDFSTRQSCENAVEKIKRDSR